MPGVMTNKQLIRKYCKMKFPVGMEIHDPRRGTDWNGPYVIKKSSVFDAFQWTAEDYSDEGRPEDPEEYIVDIAVRNSGKESPDYQLEGTTIGRIKYWIKCKEEWDADEPNRLLRQKERVERLREQRVEKLLPFASELQKDLNDSVFYSNEYLARKLQELMEKYGYVDKNLY